MSHSTTKASSVLEPPEVQPFVRISLQELANSTSRRIVLGVSSPLILLQLFVAARWPGQYAYVLGQTTILLLITVVATWTLEKRHFRSAQILWLIGYSLTVFVAIHLLQQTALSPLLILVPLTAVVMLSSVAAVWGRSCCRIGLCLAYQRRSIAAFGFD